MNKKLLIENKKIRESRPKTIGNKSYTTFETDNYFQIFFKSRGCKNLLAGLCIMCDYGIGENLTPNEIINAFDNALKEAKKPIRLLLINTYGSVLDELEISSECFDALLDKIKDSGIKSVIFETYYSTVTLKKLKKIKEKLKDIDISFEFGLESSNSEIRENYLLKNINNDKFIKTIELIHSFEMTIMANLLVGIPFLTKEEQIKDALSSIKWCIKNKVDEIVLFPVNIHPFTLLRKLYDSGKYVPISHWVLIEVLSKLNDEELSKIYLSWYGNRQLKYNEELKTIPPKTCEKCHDRIMNFYKNFLQAKDISKRKELLNKLIEQKFCDCYNQSN